ALGREGDRIMASTSIDAPRFCRRRPSGLSLTTMSPRNASPIIVLPLLVLVLASLVAAQPAEEPGVYKGRRIANVMSYAGAPWLERSDREDEEAPDKLIAKLAVQPGQNIADVGCGSGFYSRRLAPLVAPTG